MFLEKFGSFDIGDLLFVINHPDIHYLIGFISDHLILPKDRLKINKIQDLEFVLAPPTNISVSDHILLKQKFDSLPPKTIEEETKRAEIRWSIDNLDDLNPDDLASACYPLLLKKSLEKSLEKSDPPDLPKIFNRALRHCINPKVFDVMLEKMIPNRENLIRAVQFNTPETVSLILSKLKEIQFDNDFRMDLFGFHINSLREGPVRNPSSYFEDNFKLLVKNGLKVDSNYVIDAAVFHEKLVPYLISLNPPIVDYIGLYEGKDIEELLAKTYDIKKD